MWTYALLLHGFGAARQLGLSPPVFGIWTTVLRVTGLKLFFSGCFNRFAGLGGVGFFPAIIRDDCVLVDGSSVGDWVHIMREAVSQHPQEKNSGADVCFKAGQKGLRRMAFNNHGYAQHDFLKI